MTKQSLLIIGALALSTMALAAPKSYEIRLAAPAQAGQMQLAAGEYRLKVVGSDVIFTNLDTNHSFVAPVKVETAARHEVTAVETKNEEGGARISTIELGGTNETLEFGE